MLKKLAAIVLLAGLVLPHSCDVRPLTGAWDEASSVVLLGIPVLVTIAYALHQLLPPLAAFHERHGAALHGVFRAVCLMLMGAYVGSVLGGNSDARDRITFGATLLIVGGLLYWQQGRGTKAQRVPLLLLTVVGVAAVFTFLRYVDGLQYGGWIFTAGWVLAVALEARDLARTPPVAHGG